MLRKISRASHQIHHIEISSSRIYCTEIECKESFILQVSVKTCEHLNTTDLHPEYVYRTGQWKIKHCIIQNFILFTVHSSMYLLSRLFENYMSVATQRGGLKLEFKKHNLLQTFFLHGNVSQMCVHNFFSFQRILYRTEGKSNVNPSFPSNVFSVSLSALRTLTNARNKYTGTVSELPLLHLYKILRVTTEASTSIMTN